VLPEDFACVSDGIPRLEFVAVDAIRTSIPLHVVRQRQLRSVEAEPRRHH